MEATQIPWTDVRSAPRLLWQSWRRHRASGSPLADFAFDTHWKSGPAAHADGPFMISVTQFTPKWMTDIPDIWIAADSLGDQLARIDGAIGVTTYIQPVRRHIGSISIWADDSGLAKFMNLPDHVDIMRRYRPRGLPVRSATWWSEEFEIGATLAEGLQMLNNHPEKRVVQPTT